MKKMSKKLILVVSLLLALSMVFTACGSNGNATTSTDSQKGAPQNTRTTEIAKGEKNLIMYLIGDEPVGQKEVYAEINKRMKKEIKTTVTVKNIPWAEAANKYQLLFASGEQFDCSYSASWMSYMPLATKNAFLPLNEDMIKTYAPKTYEFTPKESWNQVKVKDKIYMIPANKGQAVPQCVVIRGDLREKNNIPEVKTYDDFSNYLIAQAKDKSIITFNGEGSEPLFFQMLMTEKYGIEEIAAQSGIPIVYKSGWKYLWDMPEYINYINYMKKLNDAGVFPKNMLSNKVSALDNFKNGKTACFIGKSENISSVYNIVSKEHPEWKIEIASLSNDIKQVGERATDSGFSINAQSKNAERALMMYDLFRTNKDYYDLTNYGIEGKHYEKVGDLEYKQLQGGKDYSAFGDCQWGWAEKTYYRQDATLPQLIKNNVKIWNSNLEVRPIHGWSFDDSNVKNEMAALTEISATIVAPLNHGFLNPNTYLNTLKAKSMAAGAEKVMNEAKTQSDKFLATYGK